MTERDEVPTTAEVRERFIDGFPFDTWAVARATLGDEFDRWLSAHDEAVRREERTRIREREDELEDAFQSRDWTTVEHLIANPDAPPVGTPKERECTCPTHPPATRKAVTEAKAEAWDEAIAAVAAWWQTPEDERGVIVNPYGTHPADRLLEDIENGDES